MWPAVKTKPGALKPHLVVKLKAGYRLDRKGEKFVSSEGRSFSPGGALPKGSRIVPTVPALARAAPEALSEHELNLARYVHIILARGKDPARYLAVVQEWECVEEASLPPEISLPKQAASA